MSIALAIFAKTKRLSPVKTRLAADLGKALAEQFYDLSVNAVAAIAKTIQTQSNEAYTVYWALAEKAAIDAPQWQCFNTIWTGEGDFGMRLHTVYSTLQKRHDQVILIGTDSPQLEPKIIINASKKLHAQPTTCILGPALDGGFYLFAAKVAIPASVWTQVDYSHHTTLQTLCANLTAHHISIKHLSTTVDVDTIHDLKPLLHALNANTIRLPAQQTLKDWLQKQLEMITNNSQ